MTTFDDREHAFEAHFAFEEELDFMTQARRDRLVAAWAGGLMGLKDGDLEAYVLTVIKADLREAGDSDVYDKVLADLAGRGVPIDPREVRRQMALCLVEARTRRDASEIPQAD